MISIFEKQNKFSWLIVLIGAILIFYISTLNFGGTSYDLSVISILYHFSAFFCFSFFVFISITQGKLKKTHFLIGFLISAAYAISDEIHQSFIPWRYCSVTDFLIDSTGIIFALIIYLIIILWRKN